MTLLKAIAPETLTADYVDGGELTVTRYEDDAALSRVLGGLPPGAERATLAQLVVTLGDGLEGAPVDVVSFHAFDESELAHIDRAMTALAAAREALLAGRRGEVFPNK